MFCSNNTLHTHTLDATTHTLDATTHTKKTVISKSLNHMYTCTVGVKKSSLVRSVQRAPV